MYHMLNFLPKSQGIYIGLARQVNLTNSRFPTLKRTSQPVSAVMSRHQAVAQRNRNRDDWSSIQVDSAVLESEIMFPSVPHVSSLSLTIHRAPT